MSLFEFENYSLVVWICGFDSMVHACMLARCVPVVRNVCFQFGDGLSSDIHPESDTCTMLTDGWKSNSNTECMVINTVGETVSHGKTQTSARLARTALNITNATQAHLSVHSTPPKTFTGI